ncbi:MAG: hypothetical protein HY536_00795, partial [Candidatus Colwellbacteria bacterium]|nr:hypothetical protein [Candidatus Colwellbacteria bacterium]
MNLVATGGAVLGAKKTQRAQSVRLRLLLAERRAKKMFSLPLVRFFVGAFLLVASLLFYASYTGSTVSIEGGGDGRLTALVAHSRIGAVVKTSGPLFELTLRGLRGDPSDLSVSTFVPVEPRMKTPIVFVGGAESGSFKSAAVALKKFAPESSVNAVLSCGDADFDAESGTCRTDWKVEPIVPRDRGADVVFATDHFSALAGAYLEILNVESNLTAGDYWETSFRTFSQSDLKIRAADGTHYPDDISFEGIFCGENQVPNSHIDWTDADTLTVPGYSCDGKISKIRNTAVSSGRLWIALSFGETENAKAHNFACNTGTLNDTCT